jgi:predicted Rossmann fold nucleotide-binding protein DprA/Smf involved in DNA uptake
MEYLGNKAILEQYKVGFLCSRKIPAEIILKTYDWAIEQRDKGVCIVSGFHSKIERDVFDILIKGKQPIIMVLARGLKKRWEPKLKRLLDNNRLLIISHFPEKIKRITEDTAKKRNEVIAEISDEIMIAYTKQGGSIEKIIKELKNSANIQSINR